MNAIWRSEDNFQESVLSFHPFMGSKDRTQVARLAQQAPSPIESTHKMF